ncbi:MAG: tetratricopeptide repeat protein [Dysgonomonas sp.]
MNIARMRNTLFLSIILLLFSSNIYPQASSERLIRRGVSMHDKGRYKEAIDYYKEALKINPGSMSATYEMSLSYLYLKDYEDALKYSTKVINSNFQPLLLDAYCVKSSALAELNKVDDAIKLLNEAVRKCGDEYLLHYNLGLSYFKINDLNQAAIHLRKAIEVDTTHASAFLLYAYVMNDSNKWVQSFLSFHFFLLLEPNTERSKDAFGEMYEMLISQYPKDSPKLLPDGNIEQKYVYDYIQQHKPTSADSEKQFVFFEDITRKVILMLNQMQDDTQKGLLWDFFVPIYSEIMASGYLEAYCRYVSACYFPSSMNWWNKNTKEVDKFINWFEDGQGTDYSNAEDEELGDDSEDAL